MKVLNQDELKKKLGLDAKSNTEAFPKPEEPEDPKKRIQKVFLSALARREYSQQELMQKASTKGFDSELADEVLSELLSEGYQSDQRYAEMLVRSRINKQTGPFKIKMELKQKGVPAPEVALAFENIECDWFELALEAAQKKSSSWRSFEFEDQAKMTRFLQGRGFEQDHIQHAIEELKREIASLKDSG